MNGLLSIKVSLRDYPVDRLVDGLLAIIGFTGLIDNCRVDGSAKMTQSLSRQEPQQIGLVFCGVDTIAWNQHHFHERTDKQFITIWRDGITTVCQPMGHRTGYVPK